MQSSYIIKVVSARYDWPEVPRMVGVIRHRVVSDDRVDVIRSLRDHHAAVTLRARGMSISMSNGISVSGRLHDAFAATCPDRYADAGP